VPNDIWSAIARRDSSRATAAFRLSQRVARIGDVWTAALSLAEDLPDASVQATIDRGIVRVAIPRIAEDDLHARLKRVTDCARVFEVLPASLWNAFSPSAVADPLSQRVRAAFDPDERLNPGILG
jgi:hypothetical protein